MFHWICPECGREIPPAVRECPACDPQIQVISEAVTPALAEPAAVPEVAPVLSFAPEPVAVSKASEAAQETPAEVAVAAGPEPMLPQAVLPQTVLPAPALPEPVLPEPVPNALAMAEQKREAQEIETAAAKGPEPVVPQAALQQPVLPQPVLDDLLAMAEQIRDAQEVQKTAAGLAELASAIGTARPVQMELILTPAAPARVTEQRPLALQQAAQPVALLAAPAVLAEPAPAALAEPVPAVRLKPTPPVKTAERSKELNAPVMKAPAPPAPPPSTLNVDQPPSGSWLRLAPLQNFTRAAGEQMRPCAPMPRILTQDSGPRMTLPGPMLTPELQERKNLHVLTALGDRRGKAAFPGWAVSLLVMVLLLGAGIALISYVLPSSHTTADAKSTAPATEVEPVAATAASASALSHPLASFVEVTGIRFILDLNKKSEVHYLVVNHSATDLMDMTVYVTVKAANAKPGQPPLCRFSFPLTGLGPFESKEMVSSIEKISRPVELPDWQDLRAEVTISQ